MRSLLLFACCGALACAADLSTAHNVYLLPMSRGIDQYLAVGLTKGHVLQVVTDPKMADVILTDHIGEGFEAQVAALYPPPPPPPEKKTDKAAKTAPANDAAGMVSMFADAAGQSHATVPPSSFSRTRGTIFLVDAKTHEVLWSTYDPPKDTTGKALDRTANDIVGRLKKDLGKK